jgi:hypothetical protein
MKKRSALVSFVLLGSALTNACGNAPAFRGESASNEHRQVSDFVLSGEVITESADDSEKHLQIELPVRTEAAAPATSLQLFSERITELPTSYPTKLVLIVDDSSSMDDKQAKLADALKDGLRALKGRSVEVFLYSTTQVGPSSFDEQAKLQNAMLQGTEVGIFRNYVGTYATGIGKKLTGRYLSEYVANPGSSFNLSTKPFLAREIAFVRDGRLVSPDLTKGFAGSGVYEKYIAGPSRFSSQTIKIKPEMADEEFEATISRIASEVKIGSKGASNAELPLCTLATLLMNEGPSRPFAEGDKVAFLILTDEDQANLDCLYEYRSEVRVRSINWIHPKHRYEQALLGYQVRCDSQGSNRWCDDRANFPLRTSCRDEQGNVTCAASGVRDCSAAEYQEATEVLMKSLAQQIKNGTARLRPESLPLECKIQARHNNQNYGPLNPFRGFLSDSTTKCSDRIFRVYASMNQPAKFDVIEMPEGKTVKDYLQEINPTAAVDFCYEDVSSHETTKETLNSFPGVVAKDQQSLLSFIRKSLAEKFSPGNAQILLIGNLGAQNPPECSALTTAASTLIRQLSGERSISICEPSYARAIRQFEHFAKFTPRTEYALPFDPRGIVNIAIKKKDGTETPVAASDYDLDRQLIKLKLGVEPGDEIRIFYE